MQQAERLLADSRAETFAINFVQQWLGLPGLRERWALTPQSFQHSMRSWWMPCTLELELLFQQGLPLREHQHL